MKIAQSDLQFSLLYPNGCGCECSSPKWGEQTLVDLGIDKIVIALSDQADYRERIKEILFELPTNPRVIRYRQQILEDFLRFPELIIGFTALLPLLSRLREQVLAQSQDADDSMQRILGRLTELNLYVHCVHQLQVVLDDVKLESEGLNELERRLAKIVADETFQALEAHLPELLKKLNTVPSITIGVKRRQLKNNG